MTISEFYILKNKSPFGNPFEYTLTVLLESINLSYQMQIHNSLSIMLAAYYYAGIFNTGLVQFLQDHTDNDAGSMPNHRDIQEVKTTVV